MRWPDKTVTSTKNKCSFEITLSMTHYRLGHVSLSKMQHLAICHCTGLNEYNCNVCLCSKQHRLPFNISTTRDSACFDLILLDLW